MGWDLSLIKLEPTYAKRISSSELDPYAEKLATWLGIEATKSRKQRRNVKQIYTKVEDEGQKLLLTERIPDMINSSSFRHLLEFNIQFGYKCSIFLMDVVVHRGLGYRRELYEHWLLLFQICRKQFDRAFTDASGDQDHIQSTQGQHLKHGRIGYRALDSFFCHQTWRQIRAMPHPDPSAMRLQNLPALSLPSADFQDNWNYFNFCNFGGHPNQIRRFAFNLSESSDLPIDHTHIRISHATHTRQRNNAYGNVQSPIGFTKNLNAGGCKTFRAIGIGQHNFSAGLLSRNNRSNQMARQDQENRQGFLRYFHI